MGYLRRRGNGGFTARAKEKGRRRDGTFSLRQKRGGISIFLCMILSAVLLVETVYFCGAWMRGTEANLQRCMTLQMSDSLSKYNQKLLDMYGLYASAENPGSYDVFNDCFPYSDHAEVRFTSSAFLDEEQLKNGAVEYAKLRFPGVAVSTIVRLLKSSADVIESSGAEEKLKVGENSAGKYLSDLLSKKDDVADILEKAKGYIEFVDFTGSLSMITDFLDDWSSVLKRSGTLAIQGAEGELDFVNGLDPASISSVMNVVDNILNLDVPDWGDSLLYNEYVLGHFDSRLSNGGDSSDSFKEVNYLGVPYAKIHSENKNDLEYILTGIENEFLCGAVCNNLVFAVRFAITYAEILLDKEDMEIAKTIAVILEAVILALTVGHVDISADILQYLVVGVWAAGESLGDVWSLLQGNRFPLFENDQLGEKLSEVITMGYRDYFRLFLLFLPEEHKLYRTLKVIKRDCGETLPIQVSMEVALFGETFRAEKGYGLYEV